MKFTAQKISELYLINPDPHEDERGIFRRSFCVNEFKKNGISFEVKQGNISENFNKHTMRGFHYQVEPSNESKIISCVTGSLYNVVIDLREKSQTFKQWVGLNLDAVNRDSIYVPAGCANAFLTMSNNTIVHYYMGDSFNSDSYRGIRYNDPYFSVEWPNKPKFISKKDLTLPDFQES
ncbi:MAG: dTDP-4-dehydrorhamnose 3,5-epimerase family protein [Gammaproteobacteria bacterium]|nr:dTDP-4-dehydrorhamnose 3,5-epimerase family protein [Gammaproteobacteria bacterium]